MRISLLSLALSTLLLAPFQAHAGPKEDLIQAMNRGRSDLVQVAIQQGAKVNQILQIGSLNITPLDWAAKNGNAKLITFLLNKGADPNLKIGFAFPALSWAVAFGNNLETVKILVERGADIHYVDPSDGTTILMTAAMGGNVTIVKYLISKGLDLKKGNFEGYDCLMVAARNGHFHLLRYLLKQGMKLEREDLKGRTVLTDAIYGGHKEIVKYYLSHANDPRAFIRALDYASFYKLAMLDDIAQWKTEIEALNSQLIEALKSNNDDQAQQLLQAGANPNARSPEDLTALDIVILQDKLDMLKKLHLAGADIQQVNETEQAYLSHAAGFGHLEMVKYLLDQGLDINARDIFDSNALLGAAIAERKDVVKFLLERGAEIQDKQGVTVLMQAAELGQLQAIKLLVELGLDPTQKDHLGKTALDYAQAANEIGIVNYLKPFQSTPGGQQ